MSGERRARKSPTAENAHETERFVLAACLFGGRGTVDGAARIIGPEHFGDPRHGATFRAMRALADRGDEVLWPTVLCEMRTAPWTAGEKYGDDPNAEYLTALDADYVGCVGIERGARIVRDCATLRALSRAGAAIQAEADVSSPLDAAETIARCQQSILTAFDAAAEATVGRDVTDVGRAYTRDLQARMGQPSGQRDCSGVRSGLLALDRLTRGWQPGHLYTIGGDSGHGKTALGCHLAIEPARRGDRHVHYTSVEVPGSDIYERMVAGISGINGEALRCGMLTADDVTTLTAATAQVAQAKGRLTIFDPPSATVADIDADIRRYKRQPGAAPMGLVLVDYLQLVRPSRNHRSEEQAVADVADGLLALAKRHVVPVVAFAQLNRDLKSRQDKRPVTSDLRYSARIEHNSTGVMFLFRPIAYDLPGTVTDAEVIIRKHRLGRTGTAEVFYDQTCHRFRDRERRYAQAVGDE